MNSLRHQKGGWLLLWLLVCLPVAVVVLAQGSDPTTMNGGSLLAMTGRNCVALAVDQRFGGTSLIDVRPRSALITNNCLVGFTGLESDVQSLRQELQALITSKLSRGLGFAVPEHEDPLITPASLASLLSHVLYGRRRAPYYVEPIVAGLDDQDQPFLCSFDTIGAASASPTFCCAGAAATSLYGTAESLWRPQLQPDELVRVCGQAFTAALERDCLSGYGTIVYLLTLDAGGSMMVVEYELATRND
jgi:20S proteasome subunit beta 3